MITRRSFLKSAGLASIALGAGFGAGKLASAKASNDFSVYGFIPAEENVVTSLLNVINRKYKISSLPLITANDHWKNFISRHYSDYLPFARNRIDKNFLIRLSKLGHKVESDLLISDSRNFIYEPENDFTAPLLILRDEIRTKEAGYVFFAERRSASFMESLFVNKNEKFVIIENEKGIFDKITLDKTFKEISVHGSLGKMVISIMNGAAHIHSSCCKNKICEKSGYAVYDGDLLACAPNKVLVKIEYT